MDKWHSVQAALASIRLTSAQEGQSPRRSTQPRRATGAPSLGGDRFATSKASTKFDVANPFIPSQSRTCIWAETVLVFSIVVLAIAAALAAGWRHFV